MFAVDGCLHAAEEVEVETCGGDDDVCVEACAVVELDAGGGDGLDGVGYDVGFAGAEGFEIVAVRAETHALLPGPVARLEVWVDGEVGWELAGCLFDDEISSGGWEPHAEFVEEDGDEREHEAWVG